MLNFENMMNKQLMLFVLLALGILLAKVRLVDKHSRGVISEIVIMVLMPCSILSSFLRTPLEPALLASFFVAVAAGFGVHLFSLLLARLLYRRQEAGRRAVLQFATISSNAAFIGIPVVDGLFGDVGVLFTAGYLVSMNIFMWSVGLGFFEPPGSESGWEKAKKTMKKVALQPGILASLLGLALFVAGVRLPVFLTETISGIGHCTTVFSMLVVGHVMAGEKFLSLFTKQTLFFCLVRLFLLPLAALGGLLLLRPDPVVTSVVVVLTGMPAASSTVMVANRHDTETAFASKLVSLSTAVSMLSIPLVATLAGLLA